MDQASPNEPIDQFAFRKSTSFEPEILLLNDDLLFELYQPLDRVNRSKSHVVFKYRPEFVPKLKAKCAKVCPSPMKLQSKYDNVDDDNFNCLSDHKSSFGCKDTQTYSNKCTISDLRKELHQIKLIALVNKTKDSEHILVNPFSLKRKKRRSFFSKAIKNYLEDREDEEFKSNKIEFSPVKQRHYSILSLLEYAAGNLCLCKSKSTLL